MPRKANAIFKGTHSQAYYFLYSRPDQQDKRRLILRLMIDDGQHAETAIIFKDENVKVRADQFNNIAGRLIGGYDSDTINQINVML